MQFPTQALLLSLKATGEQAVQSSLAGEVQESQRLAQLTQVAVPGALKVPKAQLD